MDPSAFSDRVWIHRASNIRGFQPQKAEVWARKVRFASRVPARGPPRSGSTGLRWSSTAYHQTFVGYWCRDLAGGISVTNLRCPAISDIFGTDVYSVYPQLTGNIHKDCDDSPLD